MNALATQDLEESSMQPTFAPEAECEFDVVPPAKIQAWRKKLNEQYGIGTRKLVSIEEPK
ncbi:MAG: hypothetical protein ABJM82_16185 [Shimia thalassica]|uniref:hypothetical protein n=1 Tax=Shimia thalassica TaxID=1715693 RepID=UPI0032996F8A